MKRCALIAGLSIAALVSVESKVSAWTGDQSWWGRSAVVAPAEPAPRKSIRKRSRSDESSEHKAGRAADKTPPIPTGVLHIIVSIDKQRATLFADGVAVATTPMSSGTPGHPTPMGVFTVIQKSRHHVSNLYNASMPYMQRITWSGSALHQGPLPGYPASHGCVRLTENFAQLLWKTTKMGTRVIVTHPDVAPLAFEHARLFVPKPKMVEVPRAPEPIAAEPATTSGLTKVKTAEPAMTAAMAKVRTADATNATVIAVTAIVGDASKPIVTSVVTEPAANARAEQPTKLSGTDGAGGTPGPLAAAVESVETQASKAKSVEAKPAEKIAVPAPIVVDERPKTMPAAIVQEANGRPISVFASLKDGKLYVRQGWKPLFETPVSFERPDQPVGTHVYTAMGVKSDGSLRWTVVSIPSSSRKRVTELKIAEHGRKSRHEHVKAVEVEPPMPTPSAALDRLVLPPDVVERISGMITPGSSLIVSDNRLSDETGEYTDFIVLTR